MAHKSHWRDGGGKLSPPFISQHIVTELSRTKLTAGNRNHPLADDTMDETHIHR
jgi:hypothetical protein